MAKSTVKFKDSVAEYERIAAEIAARRFSGIYLLMGEESYFIDALAEQLAATILDEASRAFNQITVYGRDSEAGQIINLCRQIPHGWIGEVAGLAFLNCKLLGGMTIPLTLGSWTLEFPEQGLALLALIPIWLYKGRQGAHNKAIQYACYAFYPAHMLILALLRMYL